jgi:hypothetical protein
MQKLTIQQMRERTIEEAKKRGVQIDLQGGIYRLTAPGVDIRTTDLSWIGPGELDPDKSWWGVVRR